MDDLDLDEAFTFTFTLFRCKFRQYLKRSEVWHDTPEVKVKAK